MTEREVSSERVSALLPVDGLEVVALDLANRIEREFYYDQPGGAVQTRAKVQLLISEALSQALSQASSVIAGLKAEVADLRDEWQAEYDTRLAANTARRAAEARISSLEEENKRLREALELVEDVAENYMNFDPDSRLGLAIASARQALEDHNG